LYRHLLTTSGDVLKLVAIVPNVVESVEFRQVSLIELSPVIREHFQFIQESVYSLLQEFGYGNPGRIIPHFDWLPELELFLQDIEVQIKKEPLSLIEGRRNSLKNSIEAG
jgi:hypothetical protein